MSASVRQFVKRAALLTVQLLVLPAAASSKLYERVTGRESLFVAYAQLFSLVPGTSGCYVRRAFYTQTLTTCGNDLCAEFGVFFSHRNARVGQNVYLGSHSTIGTVVLGDGVMIGSNVDILSSRYHHLRDAENRLTGADGTRFEGFEIGEHTWVGNRAVIMANVGRHCTVGAGGVVVKDVADGQTVVGNPARPIVRGRPETASSRSF